MNLLKNGMICRFAISLLLTLITSASIATSLLPPELEQELENFGRNNSFSGVISVHGPQGSLYRRYFGLADRENKVYVGPKTVFRIGSITKEMTAVSILILAERGLIGLTDSVSKFLPVPSSWKNIQIKHLLNHSAGIENQATFLNYRNQPFFSAPDKVLRDWLTRIDVLRPTGSFGYSNAGYNVLAAIAERILKKPFHEILAELIFKPLKMNTASVTFHPLPNQKYAKGYSVRGEPVEFDMSSYVGGGEVTLTIDDFHRWSQALIRPGLLLKNPGALLENLVATRWGQYGKGVMVQNKGPQRFFGHNGHTPGFVSSHFIDSKSLEEVVIFTNDERFTARMIALDPIAFKILRKLEARRNPLSFLYQTDP